MKKSLTCFIILSYSLLKLNAQAIPENDNLLIDKFVKSILSIEKVQLVSDTLAKVFTGTFYTVTPVFTVENSIGNCGGYTLVVDRNELTKLEELSTTKKMDFLFSLLRKDFYIKSIADAKVFETSLDYIYPLSWSEVKYKAHFKLKDKWYFVRGDFNESKIAFVITLGQNSGISQIEYNLEAIKK